MKNHALVTMAALVAASASGCNSFNRESAWKDVENGAVVYSNGLLSSQTEVEAKAMAKRLGIAAISAQYRDDDVLEMLEIASRSTYGVHFMAHSAGIYDADNLVKKCNRLDIPIRSVHSMEAHVQKTFNGVENVVNYNASPTWFLGEHRSLGGRTNTIVNVPKSNHANLPKKSSPYIERIIVNGKREAVAYRKNSTRSGK